MWTVFFIIALLGIFILLFYIMVELNEFEKNINTITEEVKKHYEAN